MKVVTAEQMREIDRVAIEERGIPGLALMERAGRAVARESLERVSPESVAVLAGQGNNGGDGVIAARYLHQAGVRCDVMLFGAPEQIKGDALLAWQSMPPKIPTKQIETSTDLLNEVQQYDLIVDAPLGTGTRGPAMGLIGEAIDAMNASRRPIVSVDIPSGLPADGQAIEGPCVRAALTVTMGLPKLGMLMHPGMQMTGIVVTENLNFPADLLENPAIQVNVLNPADVGRMLPRRPPDGNKGTFGKLLVLAGSRGMSGAAILATKAALRSGVGLVYVGTLESLMPAFDLHLVEAVKRPIHSRNGASFDSTSVDDALRAIDGVDAVVLGPGIGLDEGTIDFVRVICERCEKPIVIDADGINALSQDPSILKARRSATVITPHPGEMARLAGKSIDDIQRNRIQAARDMASQFNVTVLLKGAQTLIARPDGELFINTSGNTGLAKGGSGDVLTGLIGGLLAQGMDATNAAVAGAFLHGMAGDLTATKMGVRAMIPGDILNFFGEAFRGVEKAANSVEC